MIYVATGVFGFLLLAAIIGGLAELLDPLK